MDLREALERCLVDCRNLDHKPGEYHLVSQACPVEAKINALLNATHLYECHLTYDGVNAQREAELTTYAATHGWKTSFIDGDPALGPGKRERMAEAAAATQPIREKIEHVVHDTKYGIRL